MAAGLIGAEDGGERCSGRDRRDARGGARDPFYTPEVAFVDGVVRRHHLHNGFGSYWTAKPITLFSKTGTTVVVLHDNYEPPRPNFWIANPNWWVQRRNRPKGLGPVTAADYPIFDFVLCPSLNRQWVERTSARRRRSSRGRAGRC